jgi:hypothetical protein
LFGAAGHLLFWFARPFCCRALSVAVGLALITPTFAGGLDAPTSAEQRGQVEPAEKINLDIPSQPLAAALERYGDITGREILYDSNLTIDRRSGAVRGSLTPEQAINALLAGTGISARYMANKSFVLEATPAALQQSPLPSAPDRLQHYYGRIQASLRNALCHNARPGRYRIAARFWIGPAGNVSRHERLSSTGDGDLDGDIDRTLRNLDFGEPPPSGFAQPVTIVIMPQAPGVTMGCDAVGSDWQSRKAGP